MTTRLAEECADKQCTLAPPETTTRERVSALSESALSDPAVADVFACAIEGEADQYEVQYGQSNVAAGVLYEAARIVRGLNADYDYLRDEALSRAEKRSASVG